MAMPSVVVADGVIVAVSGPDELVPADAHVMDLPGLTLLPRLVDAHSHLCFDATSDPVGHLAETGDDELREQMAEAARRALGAGVTTVRDLGDRGYLTLDLRDRDRSGGAGPLPAIVAAGPPITTPGGHCHFLGGATSGELGLRTAVRERAERGVDLIKVMASGGNMTPGSMPHEPQFGVRSLRAIVDEAHHHGLPVTARCRRRRRHAVARPRAQGSPARPTALAGHGGSSQRRPAAAVVSPDRRPEPGNHRDPRGGSVRRPRAGLADQRLPVS
jgi:imidazolonepropionase-like amidohydrolase